MINKLVVVGVGLIGGSVALSLKKKDLVKKVVGIGRGRANLNRALSEGVIDEIADINKPINNASLVLISAPVSQNFKILKKLSWAVDQGVVITDAGSTKRDFVNAVKTIYPSKLTAIVPGHPIAGGENVGVGAAKSELFLEKRVIVTPLKENSDISVDMVSAMWQWCGAQVSKMNVEDHDAVFSAVSHLPHVLSYALVQMISNKCGKYNLFDFSGGGFKDFTRIAGSSPEMWKDICMANRDFIVDDIRAYQKVTSQLLRDINDGNAEKVMGFFERSRATRQIQLLKKND